MTTYLLDANVLIAMTVAEHEHHLRTANWASSVESFAVSHIVEGALARFLIRIGESNTAVTELLRAIHANPRCEFWSDSLSYANAELTHVRGHRQITNAYLASLAADQGGVLATLDQALADELPGSVALIPSL